LAFLAVANSLIVSIYLSLLIRKKIHYFHLFYLFPFYIIVYIYDHGDDFNRHGAFSMMIFLLFLFLFVVLISFFIYIYRLIKNRSFIKLLTVLFIILLPFQYFHYISKVSSCDNWNEGLNFTRLKNTPNVK
jgi:hypothetical protein